MSDTRDYATTDYDAYLQRVTAAGFIPPGWPLDGLPIAVQPGSAFITSIAPDGVEGVFVAWEHFRTGTSNDIFAQHVLPDGSFAPGWPTDGVIVSQAARAQRTPRVVSDGNGGAYVAWWDERLGSANADIYGHHVLPGGTVDPAWPADGLGVCTLPGLQYDPDLVADGHGGAFLSWSIWSAEEIRIQRLTPTGADAPGWPANGISVSNLPGAGSARLCMDGAGGVLVAWMDQRTRPPGSPYPPDYNDIYVQGILPDGAVAPGWPANGLGVCTVFGEQQLHRISQDGEGGMLLVWDDYRDWETSNADQYAARVLDNGTLAPGWPENGRLVSGGPNFELQGTICADGGGGAYVGFVEFDGVYDMRAQHLMADGSIAPGWPVNGADLTPDLLAGESPVIVAVGPMDAIVAWEDQRGGIKTIYAQKLGGDGPVDTKVTLVSAEADADRAVLTWFATDAANLAATVYRRTPTTDWQRLGSPTTDGSGTLRYEDRDVTPDARYAYRLGYTVSGAESFTAETWLDIPTGLSLALNGFRPNPAVNELIVAFTLPTAEPASLELLDLNGRRVLREDVGTRGPGRHLLRLGAAAAIPAGIYWLRLRQGARTLSARGAVLR